MKKIIALYNFEFLIVCSFIFLSLIIQRKSLIATGDCFNQYYPTLQYIVKTIKEGDFSAYDTAIGFGDDVIGSLSYYGLGDVLLFPALFFSEKNMPYAYTLIAIMKMWLAGLAFIIFCKHKGISNKLYVTCGIAYGLSFYMLQNGLSAYGFLTAPVYFPLIVMGLESVYKKRSVKWFVILGLLVFLQALNGFYFLYADIIVCLAYGLLLIIEDITSKYDWKDILQRALMTVGAFLVGIVASSFLLVPVILHFFQSQRSSEGTNIIGKIFSVLSKDDYIERVKNLISPAYGLYQYGFGLPIICILVFLFLMYRANRYKKYLVFYLIIAFGYLFPAIGIIMNGFSYNTSRWLYIAFFVLLYVTFKVLPEMVESISKKEIAIMVVMLIALLIFNLIEGNGLSGQVVLRTIWVACCSAAAILPLLQHSMHYYSIIIVGNIAIIGFLFFSPMKIGGMGTAASFVDFDEAYKKIYCSDLYKLASKDSNDLNNYYRVDFNDTSLNAPSFIGVNTTFMYYSIPNGHIINLFEKLRVSPAINNSFNIEGLDTRQILESIFSVKYFTDSYNDQRMKKNDYYLPQGLFFEKAITEEESLKYNYLQRMNLLMNTVVIDKKTLDGEVEKITVCNSGTQDNVQYKVMESSGVLFSEDRIVADANGYLILGFEPQVLNDPGNELFLEIKNLQSDTKLWSDISLAGRTIRTRPIDTEYYLENNYDYLVNISSVAESGMLKLEFIQGGTFSFDGIAIILNQNDSFEDDYNYRLEHCLQNANHSNDRIEGTLHEESDGYLMINLPYSDRWICKVDGAEQDILVADYSFMAIYVPDGEHKIEFFYK